MNKAMTFVKEHKTALVVTAAAVGAVGLYVFGRVISKRNDLPKPEFGCGRIVDIWKEGGAGTWATFDSVKIEDLGDFGKELIRTGIYNADAKLAMLVSPNT